MTLKNAKDPSWEAPVKLPAAKPQDYPDAKESSRSITRDAGKKKPDTGPPDYTFPGHTAGSSRED